MTDGDSRRRALGDLFTLTLLSAADGSLVALAAGGQLATLGGAATVGLTVVAGAGSWLAARQAFGRGVRGLRDWGVLAALLVATTAACAASVAVGAGLAGAVTLHVLPKAAGVVLFLVAAEVAGLRLPRPRRLRVPLPVAALAAAVALEVLAQWTP